MENLIPKKEKWEKGNSKWKKETSKLKNRKKWEKGKTENCKWDFYFCFRKTGKFIRKKWKKGKNGKIRETVIIPNKGSNFSA